MLPDFTLQIFESAFAGHLLSRPPSPSFRAIRSSKNTPSVDPQDGREHIQQISFVMPDCKRNHQQIVPEWQKQK